MPGTAAWIDSAAVMDSRNILESSLVSLASRRSLVPQSTTITRGACSRPGSSPCCRRHSKFTTVSPDMPKAAVRHLLPMCFSKTPVEQPKSLLLQIWYSCHFGCCHLYEGTCIPGRAARGSNSLPPRVPCHISVRLPGSHTAFNQPRFLTVRHME